MHYILENKIRKYLESLNDDIKTDEEFEFPTGRVADTIIGRKGFKDIFEALEARYGLANIIKAICIDYTKSKDIDKAIYDKIIRNYQAKDRFLFIVVYGRTTDAQIQKLENELNDCRRYQARLARAKYKNLDNVRVVRLDELLEVLGLEKNDPIYKDLMFYDTLAYEARRDSIKFDKLEVDALEARQELLLHDNSIYFNKYLGFKPNV